MTASPTDKGESSAFLTMFVPGLALGLVVGALLAAFITPILSESGSGKATPGSPQSVQDRARADTPTSERPVEPPATPTEPAATQPAPAEPAPAEPAPTEPAPAEPAPK